MTDLVERVTEFPSAKVRVSPELMAEWTEWRTLEGRLVTCTWGSPDTEGYFEPTFTVHEIDRLGELDAAWAAVRTALPKGYAVMLRGSEDWAGRGPTWRADAYHLDGRRKVWHVEETTILAASPSPRREAGAD
jgi:hypothetical protein